MNTDDRVRAVPRGAKRRLSRTAIDAEKDRLVSYLTRHGGAESPEDLIPDGGEAEQAALAELLTEQTFVRIGRGIDLGPAARSRTLVVIDAIEVFTSEHETPPTIDQILETHCLVPDVLRATIDAAREGGVIALRDDGLHVLIGHEGGATLRVLSSGTRFLEHVLTPAEVLELREQREAIDAAIEGVMVELDQAKGRVKALNARIESMTDEGRELSRLVRSGVRMQSIHCEEREVGLDAVTYRLDTGEEIERRELSHDERQGALFAAVPEAAE